MSRPCIPPLTALPDSPSQQTLELLHRKLLMAEDDACKLSQHLAQHSKSSMVQSRLKADQSAPGYESTHPTDGESYDALVSRVCRTESAIQTIKLAMLNVKGDRDLRRREKTDFDQKFAIAKEAFKGDTNKMMREVSQLKQDLTQEMKAKEKVGHEIEQLKEALQESSTMRVSTCLD